MQETKIEQSLHERLFFLKSSLVHIEESQKLKVDLYFTAFMKGKYLSIKNEIHFLESIL